MPPVPKPSGVEFGHAALNWLGLDLLDLGFPTSREAWPRWTAVGYSCGLRLATAERPCASQLLRGCADGRQHHQPTQMALCRMDGTPLAKTDRLNQLRIIFGSLIMDPPEAIRVEVAKLGADKQLAWWFRHSVRWGLRSGLNADSLFTGGLLAFFDKLPLNQRFICDRLLRIMQTGLKRPRRTTLIEFFDYTYPTRPVERTTIVKVAEKVLEELSRLNRQFEPADWILCGFREGLLLSTRNAPLRRKLFSESTREGMRTVWDLFVTHIGPDPAGWRPQRLVSETLGWLQKVHPDVVEPNCRAVEFERIRHLFDFAFWMGLAAGANDGAAPVTSG